ncbi:DNA methylase N-4/N-6 [Pseudomonas aeruginosa]|uniref:DNA methylase N-4/N-6 n=1 Tax=Pseudomonas aeruginosa TaxID=287 RepID=UPI0006EC3939|nr:DNA methylase N-4/N-6 [Pseudomonas aeruginosa]APJ41081.1 methylase [Pseudomonas aeruginosa]APJ46700.1 methylase [Pseudomonas aeruginosa]APJ53236.1 methylase [Pseudomonas aeruginosa]MBG6666031.1 DNA methylase N-4/N-6 [Pseudomonas aeruginosa]MCS8282036.1 site-specific DNA-methyltransferase [Pseudomonas aeruginosa]
MSEFWAAPLQETVKSTGRLVRSHARSEDVIEWLSLYSESAPTSSNQGTSNQPFQRWFSFKEAFSPKFVTDTLNSLPYPVASCLDPFSGSGTTALTCRMLGISSEVVEVNPFLADLVEAKLSKISVADFSRDYEAVVSGIEYLPEDELLLPGMPKTLAEPGVNGRYVFELDVYKTIRALVRRAGGLKSEHSKLLRVLLGSLLVENSNVTINGKGRRYRKNWQQRKRTVQDLISGLDSYVDMAVADLTKFSGIPSPGFKVHRGDARLALKDVESADVAIFSPPYPNSFDYTDVYNLELWMLGYLNSSEENQALRHNTLRSHVQTKWKDSTRIVRSPLLFFVANELRLQRKELWNPHIPEMIEYYFNDLFVIFSHLKRILDKGHHAVVAIGDSQYAGVHIDVAAILAECVEPLGFHLVERGSIRSMRNSAQHGGKLSLSEHCLVFERT